MEGIHALNLLKLAQKKDVNVADIGCGPHALLGCDFVDGHRFRFICVDRKPFPGVIRENMEALPFPDGFIDGAQCINALDHTKDAEKALKELIRIARDWVYISCNLDQLTTSGKGHYWDAKEDGTFKNKDAEFNLKDYGFKIHNITYGGERRYDQIIATLVK